MSEPDPVSAVCRADCRDDDRCRCWPLDLQNLQANRRVTGPGDRPPNLCSADSFAV